MNNSDFQERFSQLESSIKDIYKLSYDPENNGWDELDAKLRTLEEKICVVLVYAVFDGANPEEKLKNLNTGKLLYGKSLIQTIKKDFDVNGIDSSILTKLENDISVHNDNCHGSNIPKDTRIIKGKANVFESLPVLIDIFYTDLCAFPYLSHYTDECKRLGTFLKYSHNLLQRPELDPKVKAVLDENIAFQHSESISEAGQYHFCLLLPANPSQELINVLRPLANIRWSVIIDADFENGEAYKMWNEINSTIVNNTALTEKLDPNQTNWYFANGRKPGLDKRDRTFEPQ